MFKYTPLVAHTLGLGRSGDAAQPEWLANWVVPVGISFYTFQTLSYTIDVHARRIEPCRSFLDFFLFVSFFPQLVAGPIVRARELLPQLEYRRPLSWPRVQLGMYRCITGLFLKMVVADGLSVYVGSVFDGDHVERLTAAQAWLGVVCFGSQIFADFAGYSGIAIGLGHLLGITFPENFRYPYISRSLSEFWTRWHITLSRWLRDYLYIPLGGNQRGTGRTYFNLLVTMLLGGLWHGAAWTYVVWGGIHGVGLSIERMLKQQTRILGEYDPLRGALDLAHRCLRIAVVFVVVHVAWVFFRAPDFTVASTLLQRMFVAPFSGELGLEGLAKVPQIAFLLPVLALHVGEAAHEWLGLKKSAPLRLAVCIVWIVLLFVIRRPDAEPFIYFQF